MCGLAGYITSTPYDDSLLASMLEPIHSRGPDDTGIWQGENIALGHKRLSILDLSEAGHQPMTSHSGRFVMAYNGEIYNFEALKAELPALNWRGHSDTEVLLESIDHFGLEETLKKCEGMFAFALYDHKTKLLYLARDPAGIKPLYWASVGDDLIFGSQLSCFMSYPNFERKIDANALALYFKYNYVPAPYAIYENCRKVEAGHILTFKQGQQIADTHYWSLSENVKQGIDSPYQNEDEALAELSTLIENSVKDHLVADVPVGVFLSGGVDSSLMTAMAKPHTEKLKSFSIGFDVARYDESPYAREVAKILGTDHHEKIVRIEEARDLIPNIPEIYDEPFADASQIPTTILARFAKEHVKVALSGDGGDELFGGYSRYTDMMKLKKIAPFAPRFLMKPPEFISNFLGPRLNFKLHIAHQCLAHKHIDEQYDALYNFWPGFTQNAPDIKPQKLENQTNLSYMCMHDAQLYMADDILTKVDRATMSTSLEARVPLLTHKVMEAACRIPSHWNSDGKKTKIFLKNILSQHLPMHLIERPKKGFALPIDIWLRTSLKDWAYSLLDDIKKDGFLPFDDISTIMEQHQKGLVDWQYSLWNMLMWQSFKNHTGATY